MASKQPKLWDFDRKNLWIACALGTCTLLTISFVLIVYGVQSAVQVIAMVLGMATANDMKNYVVINRLNERIAVLEEKLEKSTG